MFRSDPARAKGEMPRVDREGGKFGAGVIRGVSMITRGEALGHGAWIDTVMLQQVTDAVNGSKGGIKSRFTHPGLSGDGLGKFTGRFFDAKIVGNQAIADFHLAEMAHNTPDGDLAEYLMGMAESDPEAFATSIAFRRDHEAEDEFIEAHGGRKETDDDGYTYWSGFQSPDPDNRNNYLHVRLRELRAVDFVDEPAANPGGLFHRGDEIAAEAEGLLSYALGLTKQRPQVAELNMDPDRLTGFVNRFLDRHKLAIVPQKEKAMSVGTATETKPEDETTPVETPAEEASTETEDTGTETKDAGSETTEQSAKGPGQVFLDAFGDQGGVWFAQGKTFEQAQGLFNAQMRSENERLKKELAETNAKLKVGRGEEKPVSFSDPATAPADPKTAKLQQNLGKNLGAFAAGIKIKR